MLCVWKKVYEHNADEKEILEYITNEHEAEVDVSLEFPGFFYDPMDVNNLISGSSAFSKTSLNIRKFTVHILSLAWRILSITLLACEMSAIMR